MRTEHYQQWIENKLGVGEDVTCIFVAKDGTAWYSTTDRVIKYKKDAFDEMTDEVRLIDITAVKFVDRSHVELMGFGCLMLLLGLIFSIISFVIFLFFPIAMMLGFVGLILLAIGSFRRVKFYQITGPDLMEEDWRIKDTGKGAKVFVSAVEKLIG